MFLLAQTPPDYNFLTKRSNIHNLEELKQAIDALLKNIDLNIKSKDFEHLLFNKNCSKKILQFGTFIENITNDNA
jgi:hypothetical protein